MLTRSNLIVVAWVALMLIIAAYQHRDAIPNPTWPLQPIERRLNALTVNSTDETGPVTPRNAH